ncbi:hypothetical protein A2926_00990 [Candidatus Giovannonibacteria bacterium RIFCSPLOWO2_01_FULL_44_40]|uniref:Magnesium transport protein CorA n=1 Tax=Candidatus Giovannonibacteria bacterium RIFCSPHIGHO2_01_FULL_45_23 TaxID=1798325 RepID=A0A1F5VI56_9BACT|nr:MAG: hypothetical protein A2834_02700 [Candidatus Giovannonibacteria bacterium RIFCSPHIGHO2_01_FULL_45_23]OGF75159.1 MAG: hypothetical protein A3C77_03695 [Candidatus Giovannonibacteria bacterium RIFCSPHIGHO2_02_FULL_45_13]OGF80012.1 MAG: hypothetical protein A2926_00990 [Candidatus Giovannonibacteria bacterium RIFCSPLOWO2_01_FULL_44_40]
MRKEILTTEHVKWAHINKPSRADVDFIKKSFNFHPLVAESILQPTLHPAIEDYGDHLFLILHFPVIFRERVANIAAEVDFLITKNTLLTITYQTYERLDELFEKLASDEELRTKFLNHHTGPLVYSTIDWLLGSLIHDLDFIEGEVRRIEDIIFAKQGPNIVEDISHARRDILDFRRILLPSEQVLKQLPEIAKKFYGDEMEPYFADILTAEGKIQHLIENHKETIEALNATHESLLSNKISGIITVLTVFSAVIMPLNLIASIWGMNQRFMPLRDGLYDFWIVMASMGVMLAIFLALFRYKRWI